MMSSYIEKYEQDKCGSAGGRELDATPAQTWSLGGRYQHESGFFSTLDLTGRSDFYESNDHEEKRDVYEMAFEACRDMVTFLHLFNEANSRLMQIENVKADPIGPLTSDNLHGYRLQFNLGFKTGLNDISDIFSGLEPTRILNDNGPYTT
jgi:hypothetical protein